MATLIGMVFANIGVLPPGAPELNVVYKYILPLVGGPHTCCVNVTHACQQLSGNAGVVTCLPEHSIRWHILSSIRSAGMCSICTGTGLFLLQ
jgi:hypothetical protein